MIRRVPSGGGEDGFALVVSLVFVISVAAMGAAFVQVSASSARSQSHAVEQLKAFYLAEAGLAEGFLAVRMGRTGTIASETTPASYGRGDVWVESVETADSRIFLRSTGRDGGARASLGLVILPDPPPLGFFANESLTVESVLLVDGFDSTESSYAEEVQRILSLEPEPTNGGETVDPSLTGEQIAVQELGSFYAGLLTQESLEYVLVYQTTVTYSGSGGTGAASEGTWTSWSLSLSPIDVSASMTAAEFDDFLFYLVDLYEAHQAGYLFGGEPTTTPEEVLSPYLESGWTSVAPESEERLLLHTLKGGLLGSNGDIFFTNSSESTVEIHGSVVPGVEGSVLGLPADALSGSDAPRAMEADLAPVVVPNLTADGSLIVDTGIPAVVSGGEAAYQTLSVSAANDLLLRGPLTLVVEELALASDARLQLDTTDGAIDIFVTGGMNLDPGSFVETTAQASSEVSIQASGDGTSASSLDLSASSQFLGTIYAPQSDVRIGTNFEIFGSVIANRLTIGAGARLHFDDESYDGTMAIPTQEAWRLLELPDEPDTMVAAGASAGTVSLSAGASTAAGAPSLATAHDLSSVDLALRYTDASGATRSYTGSEDAFDWTTVTSVESVERDRTMTTAESGTGNWWDRWDADTVEQYWTDLWERWTSDWGAR